MCKNSSEIGQKLYAKTKVVSDIPTNGHFCEVLLMCCQLHTVSMNLSVTALIESS